MDAVSLHPAAGAQGELAGTADDPRLSSKARRPAHKVIIPDTAHGTNPASSALAGFEVVVAQSNQRGFLEAAEIQRLLDDDVAALMVTNPNTLGIFEPQIHEIAEVLHAARRPALPRRRQLQRADGRRQAWRHGRRHRAVQSAQDLLDAAWRRRPGRRPGRRQEASRAVPADAAAVADRRDGALDGDRPDSIGTAALVLTATSGCWCAPTLISWRWAATDSSRSSRLAILNANYVRKQLREHFPSATGEPSMHECVLTHDLEKKRRQHSRYRQAPARLRDPSADDLFPPGGARAR